MKKYFKNSSLHNLKKPKEKAMFKQPAIVGFLMSLTLVSTYGVHEFPISKDYGIVVNCTKLQDLVSDFKLFGEQYLAKT